MRMLKQNPDLDFASHVWSTPFQVLAPPALPKVEDLLPEARASARERARNPPSVSSIRASVPEHHPSSTTTLKHLKLDKMPPTTQMLCGLTIPPAMQAIVINCVSIVNPQLAPIIGYKLEVVMACVEYSHATSPTHSKVIAS